MSHIVPETWHHLLFKPRQIREGLGSSQLVQCDRAAIVVVIKTATHPAIRSAV